MLQRSAGFAARRSSLAAHAGLLALVAFSLTAADARAEEWRPGNSMSQAVSSVMVAARKVNDLTGYGYVEGNSFMAAFVQPGQTVAFDMPMRAGQTYAVIGGGDESAADVDLFVFDEHNRPVVSDNAADAQPAVSFTPAYDGKYLIRMRLVDRGTACFCAMAILERNGYDVPVRNLLSATASLIDLCARVNAAAGGGVRFHDAPNQWAVYGGVMREGEQTTVSNLCPGSTEIGYVATADDVARDLDVAMVDSAGNTLTADVSFGREAAVVHATKPRESYSLRRTLVSSVDHKPTLVLTAVLEGNN